MQKRLAMYVLRSKVKVADAGPQWIHVGLSGEDAAAHLQKVVERSRVTSIN
jgi:folate-binding Fe-S cluster repair protein YgfZ